MANIFFGGGLNQRDDFNISIEEAISGQNFLLDAQSRTFRPRPPFDLEGTADNQNEVIGILQLIDRNDSDTTLIATNTTVYSVDSSFNFTSEGTINSSSGILSSYWSLDDELMITDLSKENVIHSWDGATFEPHQHGIGSGTIKTSSGVSQLGTTVTLTVSAHGYSDDDLVDITGLSPDGANGEFVITNTTTNTFDYTSTSSTTASGTAETELMNDLFAKYSAVFNNRQWLFNITEGTTDNPHLILASKFEDANVFDPTQQALPHTAGGLTGNEAFFLVTPDLKPINGVAVFFNTLVISTVNGKMFKLVGNDATDYQIVEFYPGSSAIGTQTIANTGNDLMWMKRRGAIDRLSAVETSGDVQADDLSRYIPTEVQDLTDGIAVYDQFRQRVHWFVTDKVLTLDKTFLIEKPGISPWTVFDTEHPNLFNTKAASYIRVPGGTEYDVYWGDSSGRVFKMNGTRGQGDAGSFSVITERTTREISEIPFRFKDVIGRVEYRRRDKVTMQVIFEWAEHIYTETAEVILKAELIETETLFWGGDNYFGEDIYWNQGAIRRDLSANTGFSPGGKGEIYFITVRVQDTGDFLVNRLILPDSMERARAQR